MPIYEVAIIEKLKDHPERLVCGPNPYAAKNEQHAIIKAVLESSILLENYDEDAIEVKVRPF